MTAVASVRTSPWAAPRRRALALRERYPFAGEVLGLYLALLTAWEEAWPDARTALTTSSTDPDIAAWAAERVLPGIVAATIEAGPGPLVDQLRVLAEHDPVALDPVAGEQLLAAWLAGEDLVPVERYLARAAVRVAMEATGEPALDDSSAGDDARDQTRHCPRCGGPPQLSFQGDAGDDLVNSARQLQCARCGHSWAFSRSTCPSCGESRGGRLTFYAEQRAGVQVGRSRGDTDATFPQLRIVACGSCDHYLIDVDLSRDPLAVPEVDELAALPLDLYAAELGLRKITPNIMGF